jgi:DNA-binding transcriptional ArsR family regulator
LAWLADDSIVNPMVHHLADLDLVFAALSDPTRRGILERLSRGVSNVGTLARPYDISEPAISKHLKVLERAGLIRRTRRGREHRIRVDPRPIEEARGWMATYARFWMQQFDAVDACLEARSLAPKSGPKERTGP